MSDEFDDAVDPSPRARAGAAGAPRGAAPRA